MQETLTDAIGLDRAVSCGPIDHRSIERKGLMLAALVGLIVGAASVGFQLSVEAFENAGRDVFAPFARQGPAQLLLVVLCGGLVGGLAGYVTERFCPEAGGSGIPHIKAVLMNLRVVRPFGLISVKVGAGLAALLAGMSLGREGPTIQIGGAVGAWFARVSRVPERLRLSLIASGAGAGLAAAFNAPLAGFIFVMEELRREMSPLTYGLALISSVSSVFVARVVLGQSPSFHLIDPKPIPLQTQVVVVFLGIMSAFVGIAFNKLTIRLIRFREKRASRLLGGAVVGAVASLMLAKFPEVTGGGHRLAEDILSGRLLDHGVIGFMALLLVAKLVMTSSSFATGVPGGIFAPLLVMGAVSGYLVGIVASRLFPGLAVQPDVMATIGMAAVLSASVRAPLTGVVLIVEMTQQYTLLYALLIAAFVSYVLANIMQNQPIYEALLERDLHKTGQLGELPRDSITLELVVEPDSAFDGSLIKEISLPKGALITVIRRQEAFVAPRGDTRIVYGDEITVHLVGRTTEAQLVQLYESVQAPHPSTPVEP